MDTDIFINKYIQEKFKEKYQNDKEMIEKSVRDYESYILNKYKKEYPLRLLPIYYLMRFRNNIRNLKLLPSEDEYKKINIENELFDTNMLLPINIGKQGFLLQFPFIINISELSHYIDSQKLNKVSLNIDSLLNIMTEGYHDDYEIDNKNRIEKRDMLYKEKEKNPIIIMKESEATRYTIINGNHRIMHYAKMGQIDVEGYFITSEECCKFGITKDYERLYKMILNLINKVTGSIDTEID